MSAEQYYLLKLLGLVVFHSQLKIHYTLLILILQFMVLLYPSYVTKITDII